MKQLFLFYCLFLLFINTYGQIRYPETKKVIQEDIYFGTKVVDSYRWLEDDNSDETKKWVDEQNNLTFSFLEKTSSKNKIKDRLTKVWNFSRMSVPFKEGGLIFSLRNDGLQNQSSVYYQKNNKDQYKLLLDPNKLSQDGTISLSNYAVSKDGKYFAFGVSKSGSDWVEIRVMEIESGKQLNDKIEWVKFSGISWQGNGFYYSRYDAPSEGKALTLRNTNHKIYYHKIGDVQSKDVLVYEDKNHPNRNFSATVTEDGRFLVIQGSESTSGSSVIVKDLNSDNSNFSVIVSNFENEYNLVGSKDEFLYFLTDYKAPKYKLIRFNLKNAETEKWETIISEKSDLLEGVYFCGKFLVSKYLKDVSSKLFLNELNGNEIKEIKLPGLCKVEAFNSSPNEELAYMGISSFISPTTVYLFDANTAMYKLLFKPGVDFKSEDYETKQVFYTSKDGTKIPMFLTYKKGIKMDGKNPTFLYGYGGFNSYYSPEFRIDKSVLLEAGFIYAIANIRGGGEYGEDWHKAGTKCNKQNVFDDFIAAAEYLKKENYTCTDKLAIHGRSNGGLLIGAVMTQRPDLAKVCLPTVGVLDMLRYHLFTIGRAWSVDYGLSENEEEFKCLYKYSPLHNIKKGNYPATLITTGDHDDRVVPAHSFKFTAELQSKQTGKEPIFIRVDKNAGHGSGKPTSKQIEEWADIYAFVFQHLNVNY